MENIKGSNIFEIKAEQNHTFRSLLGFLELQGIDTAVRNTLFLLFCMKTNTQSPLIITQEKLAVFNEGFRNCDLCQLSEITHCEFSHYHLLPGVLYI